MDKKGAFFSAQQKIPNKGLSHEHDLPVNFSCFSIPAFNGSLENIRALRCGLSIEFAIPGSFCTARCHIAGFEEYCSPSVIYPKVTDERNFRSGKEIQPVIDIIAIRTERTG